MSLPVDVVAREVVTVELVVAVVAVESDVGVKVVASVTIASFAD